MRDDAQYHIGFRGVESRSDFELQLARQVLQQHMAMLRLGLSPTEYVAFKLRVTYERAEALVARVKEDE